MGVKEIFHPIEIPRSLYKQSSHMTEPISHLTGIPSPQIYGAGLLASADAACGKVVFCGEYGSGVYFSTRLNRRSQQGARLPTGRRRR